MAFYKCPNCRRVFSVDILVDPAPISPSSYPSMPCPDCGKLSDSISYVGYLFGKKTKNK
jgi:DNA-directed RNA polymerase subunit RPC12/RpoP